MLSFLEYFIGLLWSALLIIGSTKSEIFQRKIKTGHGDLSEYPLFSEEKLLSLTLFKW